MKIEIFVTSRSLDPVRKDNIVTDERLAGPQRENVGRGWGGEGEKEGEGRGRGSGILAWQVDASRLPFVSSFLKASANGWRKVLSSSLTQRGKVTTIPDRRASAFEILLLRRFYNVYVCKEKQEISIDPDARVSNATIVIVRFFRRSTCSFVKRLKNCLLVNEICATSRIQMKKKFNYCIKILLINMSHKNGNY